MDLFGGKKIKEWNKMKGLPQFKLQDRPVMFLQHCLPVLCHVGAGKERCRDSLQKKVHPKLLRVPLQQENNERESALQSHTRKEQNLFLPTESEILLQLDASLLTNGLCLHLPHP